MYRSGVNKKSVPRTLSRYYVIFDLPMKFLLTMLESLLRYKTSVVDNELKLALSSVRFLAFSLDRYS